MNCNIPASWYWKKEFLSGRSSDKLEQEIKDSDFLVADAKVACVDSPDKGVAASNMKLERFLYIHKRF